LQNNKEVDLKERIEKIAKILDENKGENIEHFDLVGSDYFVDGVVVCTGLNQRHNEALLDFLKRGLKPEEEFIHVEVSDGWVVIDLGDMLIHIMTKEYRELYRLEEFLKEFEEQKNG
jgi:ribosome silencing factor RsfS/YbeB/iojap